MCGISGWFDMAGERAPDRMLAKAMTDAIRHRGPDGEGHHFAPGVALGHRRLSIIDLATGGQPMFNAGKTVAIRLAAGNCPGKEQYDQRQGHDGADFRGHAHKEPFDTAAL